MAKTMKEKIFLFLVLPLLFLTTEVYAQTVKSNEVITRVGNPSPRANAQGGTNAGPLGITVSCPFYQSGGNTPVNVTCGTAKNSVNNCGHGGAGYPQPCNPKIYASCPYSAQLKAAVDVRMPGTSGGNLPVYLPYINGNQSVNWVKVSGPIAINNGSWGQKLEYSTIYNGKNIRVDMTHLADSIFPVTGQSGDRVGVTLAGMDGPGAGHLHTAASIDGVWVDSIDQSFICSNRTP